MTLATLPEHLLQQLATLESDDLNLVVAFVEFLKYKKVTQQGMQPQNQAKNDVKPLALSEFWQQWFAEVDSLPVSLTEPASEYEEGLLAKYRQQGLEL